MDALAPRADCGRIVERDDGVLKVLGSMIMERAAKQINMPNAEDFLKILALRKSNEVRIRGGRAQCVQPNRYGGLPRDSQRYLHQA